MSMNPRLPQPLTPESLVGLMREPAYWDHKHPQFPTHQRLVKRGFEILYPGPVRRSDTGNMIDTPPLAPHIVAHQVDAVNREMAAMDGASPSETGSDKTHDGMVHVESHTRDGGKTEVSDYWRNLPSSALGAREPASGHGDDARESAADHADDADKGDPKTQNDPGQDTLPGQSGEDDLAEANPPKEPPRDAFVAPDPDKLVREWSGTRQGPNEAEKKQCVGLVKKAIPEIGSTKTWREGEKIIGPGNPPLKPGTAIAIFDQDGTYTNTSGESHAAIFLGYDTQDGQQGIKVLDQFGGKEAKTRFIRFDNPGGLPVNQAARFAVIKRRR